MSQKSALERLSEDSIVIAFDYGLKRIGVAVGNLLTKSARPLRIIHWKKNDQKWAEITQVLSDWQPAAVVVGVPRHKDGKPNDMTPICERFANQVEGRYGIPVVREDERYSSVEAESYHDADDDEPIDDEAAAIILDQWLNKVPGENNENH